MKISWICAYAVLAAGWAYWCTREADGRLVATLSGFTFLGIAYWLAIYWHRPATVQSFLGHLVILEGAVVMALAVNPQLEEMAGMLNLLIPCLVFVIVLGGAMLSWLLPRVSKPE